MSAIRRFFATESAGGMVMVMAAALAIWAANSPLDHRYDLLLHLPLSLNLGAIAFSKPLLMWINDGLMAVFFLLIGLEIKREVLDGELSSRERLALPVIAAIGGMLVPALIYAALNRSDPVALRGWAIPSATDIAFSLAVLSLFGRRVPLALKVFLTAVAIVDDLGAILVIALFYTESLSLLMLALAGLGIALLAGLNAVGVRHTTVYLLVGALLWICVLKSGVHATLAGVVTAFMIPFTAGTGPSPGRQLENALHSWVAFGILPVFAFANAGLSFAAITPATLLGSIPLGIAVGLLAGKTVGVFGASALAIGCGIARRPDGVSWLALLGVAIVSGIGFTMSLFIGALAFEHQEPRYYELVKLGVVAGSFASAVLGIALLAYALPRPGRADDSL